MILSFWMIALAILSSGIAIAVAFIKLVDLYYARKDRKRTIPDDPEDLSVDNPDRIKDPIQSAPTLVEPIEVGIGTVVRLRSGGPHMTIASVLDDGAARCVWFPFPSEKLSQGDFPGLTLTLIRR